jgi:hypothetical protein
MVRGAHSRLTPKRSPARRGCFHDQAAAPLVAVPLTRVGGSRSRANLLSTGFGASKGFAMRMQTVRHRVAGLGRRRLSLRVAEAVISLQRATTLLAFVRSGSAELDRRHCRLGGSGRLAARGRRRAPAGRGLSLGRERGRLVAAGPETDAAPPVFGGAARCAPDSCLHGYVLPGSSKAHLVSDCRLLGRGVCRGSSRRSASAPSRAELSVDAAALPGGSAFELVSERVLS